MGIAHKGVAAPLAPAGCRGNFWRVVDGRRGKTDLRFFHVLAIFIYTQIDGFLVLTYGTGFRPIAQFGLHHWPSFISVVGFLHEARAGAA